MNIATNIVLKREGKKPILIDTFYNETTTNNAIVIFCHGYKGFKDWGAWHLMGQAIAEAGYCFVKFNFSHNGGTINNPIDFPDLEAFGQNNYTKELDDVTAIIDWCETYFKSITTVNTSKIYLIGHSRGGGIAIIKTAEDTRIKKLVTLASVCDFEKRTATIGDLAQWRKDGVKYVQNSRTKQQLPHYYQFYEDFITHKERLSIERATKKITVPQLIIHGDADTSISIEDAHTLQKWNPKAQLKIQPSANHVFNTKQPWDAAQPSEALQKAIDAMLIFFETE